MTKTETAAAMWRFLQLLRATCGGEDGNYSDLDLRSFVSAGINHQVRDQYLQHQGALLSGNDSAKSPSAHA